MIESKHQEMYPEEVKDEDVEGLEEVMDNSDPGDDNLTEEQVADQLKEHTDMPAEVDVKFVNE